MTVEEVIEVLMSVEDKTKEVCFDDEEWGCTTVQKIYLVGEYYGEDKIVFKG